MIKVVSSQSGVALITHICTSAAIEGYITLTSYYIDKDLESCSQVLATYTMLERDTCKNIAEEINKNVDEFKINVVVLPSLDMPIFGCAGRTLQLVVNGRLKIADVSKTLTKYRNALEFFHKICCCFSSFSFFVVYHTFEQSNL